MAGPVATARAGLVAVLEPVWPGRVRPYPASKPRPTAGIYVAELAAGWAGDYEWAGTFTVRIVADGADHAAAAMLDDLVDQVHAAVAGSTEFYPDAVSWDPFDVDGVAELPAYRFDVRADLSTANWCGPDPAGAVTLPPTPIGA